MNSEQFVNMLRTVVRDSAVSEELSVLQSPPGRQPAAALLQRSQWYLSLSEEQKELLSSIIGDVADRAVFGVLCVLDGARAIEDCQEKGRLELRYIKDEA